MVAIAIFVVRIVTIQRAVVLMVEMRQLRLMVKTGRAWPVPATMN